MTAQSVSPLDIATATMLGCSPRPAPLTDSGLSPLAAIEQEILPALRRPPCLVSFSGGRDSSAVLAVAAALARREGLDLPIPATNLFPAAAHSQEGEWQELVVSHLGLDEWLRVEHENELDVLGPYARRLMLRHGLLLPFNVHFHLPLLDAASGGSLLTGAGGDELFTAASRVRPIFRGARRAIKDLGRVAVMCSPRTIGQAVLSRRQRVTFPWLTPAGNRAISTAFAEMSVREPRALPRRMAWWRGLRYLGEGKLGLTLAASDTDVLLAHPLLGRPVWGAVSRAAGPHGFADRTDGMRRLFGDLLPDQTLLRTSKAHFNEAMWTETAREFVRNWDGTGVPVEYVDAEALYQHWCEPDPLAQSYTLLQAAWLAKPNNSEGRELVGDALA